MNLLILTQYFPPEMGAPQARLYELASRLRNKGHQITVLTAMPNYPTGRVFNGYRWTLRKTEYMDGIHVVRTWIYPSNSSGFLPRLMSYLSFVISSVVLGLWGLGRQDVVLFESPPLFMVPAGLMIGWLCRGKIVMNCSDIWPGDLVRTHNLGGILLKALYRLERFGYEHSDAVALTNPGAMRQIQDRFPHIQTTIISNGVDTSMFRPELRSEQVRAQFGTATRDFLVGYCGLHGMAQGLEVIVEAADRLRDRPNIKIIMVGDGPTKQMLLNLTKQKKLTNLTFHDARPKKEIPAILASCDVSLVPLVARLPGVMPSKIYEALSVGTPPIVAKGCEGEKLIDKYDAGRTFEPLAADELAAAILDLADNPDKYRQVRQHGMELSYRFDRAKIAQQTEDVLVCLSQGKPLPDVSW